ncbi:MAG: adenine deaminase [Chloroflexi bacterium 44-23]|nr:MAG: adenine deaminase [Chloroflexi bacterium 44-23]
MGKFWQKDSRLIVDCAMGRHPADLVITNGTWVCVQTGEYIPNTQIAIIDGRIAYIGPSAAHTIGENTEVISADGNYLVPGLLDAHMHVESGMLTVTQFVRAVLPHGTTGMFIDPHEIANVFGMRGVKLMVEEALKQPNHVFVEIPSCVPSAPGFETPGASIDAKDVADAIRWEGVIGLGEMMNFPGVAASDPLVHEEMEITRLASRRIGGHYASPDLGLPFYGYAAGGPQDDHEGTRTEDAIIRARSGMKVMMRYGSGWLDVAEQVKAITDHGLEARNFMVCTDDSHSATLVYEGHMDRVIRHTIQQNVSPMLAIQMATINTAEYFDLDAELGQLAPGRYADILFVKNLNDFHAELVIAKGKVVAKDGKILLNEPHIDYPQWVLNSVNIKQPLTATQFEVIANGKTSVTVNTIEVIESQAPTRHIQVRLPVMNGKVQIDSEKGVAKLALVERHQKSGRVQLGFVAGFGFDKKCAIASTVAHDSHQIIVVGTDDEYMAQAVNHLARIGGGQVVIFDGRVVGEVKLPIAGLMSNAPAEEVSRQAATILDGFEQCGCHMNNPNMQLSLLALVVIPELRLTDLGLVDVNNFRFIPLIVDEQQVN